MFFFVVAVLIIGSRWIEHVQNTPVTEKMPVFCHSANGNLDSVEKVNSATTTVTASTVDKAL